MNRNNILNSALIFVCLFSLLLVATHLLSTNSFQLEQKSLEKPSASNQTASMGIRENRFIQSELPPTQIPVSFIPNKGQFKDNNVKFQASNVGGSIFFKPGELHLVISDAQPTQNLTNKITGDDLSGQPEDDAPRINKPFELKVKYQGYNKDAQVSGINKLPGKMNYFIGESQADWVTDIETYEGITYQSFYPGINLQVNGTGGQIKTSFIVSPNADPSVIQWKYEGVKAISVDEDGNLLVTIEKDDATLTVKETAPIAWQVINGETVQVSATFAITANTVSFVLPNGYDPSLELVIDPTIEWSTYLGNNGTDEGVAIAHDASGNIVVGGLSYTSYYPVTSNKYQARAGNADFVVSKFDPTGTTLLYSTFLGGTGCDKLTGMVLDSQGNYILAGSTCTNTFPVVNGLSAPVNDYSTCPTYICEDIVVAKLNAAGNVLLFSSYLGGNNDDDAERVAVGANGIIYVVGRINSSNFPTTTNAYDQTWYPAYDSTDPTLLVDDIGVAAFDPTKSGSASLVYCTFLGGNSNDEAYDIAVDNNNKVYVIGYTYSTGGTFPIVNPIQARNERSSDATLSILDMTKSGADSLVLSTALGGSGREYGLGLDIDNNGNVYITGSTKSTDFATPGAAQTVYGGSMDAFVMKVDTVNKQVVYRTFLGGSNQDEGNEITVDDNGKVYVVGDTYSTDFPTESPTQTRPTESCGTTYCMDAFLTVLDASGSNILFSTYLGGGGDEFPKGVTLDDSNGIYVVGTTWSSDFPTTAGSYDTVNGEANSKSTIFVTKFSSVGGNATPALVWSAEGNLANAWFGFSVDTAGDINGDGYKDLIVGAPHYSNGESEEGAVFVYYYDSQAANYPATPGLILESNKPYAHFGWSVSSAGNVDNLHGDDIIVGAVDWGEKSDPNPGEGRAFIYLSTGTDGLSQTPAWIVAGNQAHSSLGYVVGTAGDVNNDGFSDVFVGAPNYDNGNTDEGVVYVYQGPIIGSSTTPNWTMEGGQDYAYFGLSAQKVEANGDAFGDLMVGAPNASTSTNLAREGRAYIYQGSVNGLSANSIWTVAGNQQDAHFGESVSSGDFNGDGLSDIVVGAPDYDQGETDEGAAFVYLNSDQGLSTQPAWTGESNQASAHYSISVASVGDIDQDGKDDLLVGANQFSGGEEKEGCIYIYYGSPDGIDNTRSWNTEGNQGFANFGYSVAPAGDVNNDGLPDFLVTANQMDRPDGSQVDIGKVFLYSGK